MKTGAQEQGDLSVTALYTAGTWAWAGLPSAELLDHEDARRVFAATNGVIALTTFYRKLPSLRCSLVQRHVMIDRVLAESGTRHVLEIAAGFSPRGAAFSADPELQYVELDRPAVVARKRALLERTPAGREVLERTNFRLVGGDAADADLGVVLAAPADAAVTVIAEGLLMYLDETAQRGLFERVHALLAKRGGTFVFDLVPASEQPAPGPVGRSLGWLMKRFTKGAGFAVDARGRDDIASALRAAGFGDVKMIEPRTASPDWQVPHLETYTQQLVFVARVA